jgi:phosphatidylglycerol:prolipoprotein diacylglycerol transferase
MRPILFHVFGYPVHSYGVMLLLAFFVGVGIARRRAPRFGLTPQNVYDASFWALILGVLGARAFFILQEWKYYSAHTSEVFSLQFAGLTSFGGVVFGMVGLFLWARKSKVSFMRLLDVLSGPFLIAHAIGRVGCLLNGCCYGGVCDLPWGIHVADVPGHLFHPAQIYDSLMNIAAFGILIWRERKTIAYGRSFSLAMMLHGTARFIYEFWRAGTVEQVKAGLATSTYMGSLPITDAQVAALALVAAGLLTLLYARHRESARAKVAVLEA